MVLHFYYFKSKKHQRKAVVFHLKRCFQHFDFMVQLHKRCINKKFLLALLLLFIQNSILFAIWMNIKLDWEQAIKSRKNLNSEHAPSIQFFVSR